MIVLLTSSGDLDLDAISNVEFDLSASAPITSIQLADGEMRSGRAAGPLVISVSGKTVEAEEDDRLLFRGEANGAVRFWVFSAQSTGGQPWEPELRFGGSGAGILYSARDGSATRQGNLAFVCGTISLSSKGAAPGTAEIVNLPWPAKVKTGFWWSGAIGFTTTPASGCLVRQNTAKVLFYNGGAVLSAADFANNSELYFSVWYEVA